VDTRLLLIKVPTHDQNIEKDERMHMILT